MKKSLSTAMLTGSCLCLLLLGVTTGCGDSRAKQMAELRKIARDSTTGEDEEEQQSAPTPLPTPKTPLKIIRRPSAAPASGSVDQVAGTMPATDPGGAVTSDGATGDVPVRRLAGGVTDTQPPPETPLPAEQRRQMTIDNMTTIGNALERYLEQNRRYPPSYIANAAKRPILSWRVALLPYLGYDKLFAEFRTDEAWDSTHNAKLIDKIPSVFQSPDRFDVLTNYLVPYATSTAFFGHQGKMTRRWEDGAKNTIILVEVDDQNAVPWTQPEDLAFDARNPSDGLGAVRSDGFFSVWGGGEVALVPTRIKGMQLKAAFTVDGGEELLVSEVKRPALATVGGLAATLRSQSLSATQTADASPMANVRSSASVAGLSHASPEASVGSGSNGLIADAQSAFTEGREAAAIRMYYGEIICGLPAEVWLYQFQWIPGLARPAAIVRYGVGIEWIGSNALKARDLANDAVLVQKTSATAAFGKLTKNFGNQVLQAVKQRPLHSPFFVQRVEVPKRRYRRRADDDGPTSKSIDDGTRLAPGIQLIGVESQRVLTKAARKHEVDVLVLFQINEKRSGAGLDYRVNLIDVVREKVMHESPRLNSLKVHTAKTDDLLQDDPTVALLAALGKFIDEHLVPAELPEKLRPRHAAKRVSELSKKSFDESLDTPLRAMAEIQFYRKSGLIDVPQLVNAYANLFDQDAALTLVAGSYDDRMSVLSAFLPQSTH